MKCKDCENFKKYPEGHSLHGLGIGYCAAIKDFVREEQELCLAGHSERSEKSQCLKT